MTRAASNKTRGSDIVKVNWKLVRLRQKMYFTRKDISHYRLLKHNFSMTNLKKNHIIEIIKIRRDHLRAIPL